VAVLAEQVSDRHPHGIWALAVVVRHAEGTLDFRVVRSAGEGGSEGVRVGDASCEVGAYVPLVIWLQAIDAAESLRRVELSRIFKVGGPAHIGLFGNPAFMADVPVANALVDRRHDPA
jgi:hypothetical protein